MRRARVTAIFVLLLASCGKTEQPVFQGTAFDTDPPAPGPLNGLFVTTDNGSDRLSAVDPATQKVRFTIPVGFIPVELEGPHHLVADPAGRFLYINLSEAVAGSGTGPHGAHGTGTIPGFVLKLSTKDGSQVGFAQVDPNPGDLTISPDGKTIYVTHYDLNKLAKMTVDNPRLGDSNLVVIDAATMNVTRRVALCPAAHGVRLTPDGKTLYSTCDNDEIAIVDLSEPSLPVTRKQLAPDQVESPSRNRCPYALTVAPDSSVWVSSLGPGEGTRGGGGGLDVYDPALGAFDPARSATFPQGRALFAAFQGTAASYEAYLPEQNPAGDKIHVFTTTGAAPRVDNPIPLDRGTCLNAHMMSLSPDGHAGYLVCEGDHVGPGTFTFLDLVNHTVGSSVQLGVFPDGLVLIPPG